MALDYLFLYQNTYNELYLPAIIIAGCFGGTALILSLLLTFQHLRSYTKPTEQKWIVSVIFMVPVYATESILSLWNPKFSLACDILRNCYEAFALYSFGSYLIACLGGEMKVVELLEDESREEMSKPLLKHETNPQSDEKTFRNFVCHPSVLGEDLFTIIKFGLVQYVASLLLLLIMFYVINGGVTSYVGPDTYFIVFFLQMILKTLCAFLAFILEICGVYGDGKFEWHYGYLYITIVLNFSQMWALYCLVQFYNVTHQRLDPIKPLAKFISFKAIVFATWWQGVGIVLLCTFGILPKEGRFQTALQDFLICIEMAIAAVAHIFVFSAKPYHFLEPATQCGKVTTQETKALLKVEEGDGKKPAMLEKKEIKVEAPGTSVKESVQDIVVEGGQKVVKDVVLTINQAIEPLHEGMTKIQETFHQISVADDGKEEPEVKVEEVEENITTESQV